MARRAQGAPRGAAAESISWRLGEGPLRPPPPPPFRLTYLGEGVVSVEGVGNFAHGTSASVTAEVAARFDGRPEWRVERR